MKACIMIFVATALLLAEAKTYSVKKVKGAGRVIGGQAANHNRFKFVVNIAIQEGDNWATLGTGSIISKTVILTACHCIVEDSPTRIKAGVVDVTEESSDSQVIATKGSEKHPECTSGKFFHYDVGVYFLAAELEYTSAVQPLKVISRDRPTALAELNKLAINVVTCYTAGWGVTGDPETGATPSPTLQQATLTLVDNEICGDTLCDDPANYQGDETCYQQNAESLNKLHEICTFDTREDPQTALCDGDSGAPLVCNDKVYGVLSRANCQPVSPAVFMDIDTVLYFVDKYAETT